MLYAFVTIPNINIDYFLFFPDANDNEEDVEIAMGGHEIQDGSLSFSLESKHIAEADPEGFEKDRKMAEPFARSSINFAAMGNKGRLLTQGLETRGGTAKYILKFASPCI